jgi:hypothetical protein
MPLGGIISLYTARSVPETPHGGWSVLQEDCHRAVGGIWTLAGVVQRGLGEGNNLRRPLKKSLASHDMLFINLHFTFHTYIPTRLNCYVLMIFLAVLSLCKKLK